jgi:hypothetical protein
LTRDFSPLMSLRELGGCTFDQSGFVGKTNRLSAGTLVPRLISRNPFLRTLETTVKISTGACGACSLEESQDLTEAYLVVIL